MQDVPYQATAEIFQMMARQWNIEKNREYSSLRLGIFLFFLHKILTWC